MLNFILLIVGIFLLILGLTICICKYRFSVSHGKDKYLLGIIIAFIGIGIIVVCEINYIWG